LTGHNKPAKTTNGNTISEPFAKECSNNQKDRAILTLTWSCKHIRWINPLQGGKLKITIITEGLRNSLEPTRGSS